MDISARPTTTSSLQLPTPTVNDADANPPSRRRTPKTSLTGLLIQARADEHRSIENLAEMAGLTPDAIRMLEEGHGPVSTLAAVMEALPFQVAGLAKGRSFTEQLRNRRQKLALLPRAVAIKASLEEQDVLDLEAGTGTVENLLRLLAVIGPRIYRKKMERAHWSAGDTEERNSRFTPPSLLQSLRETFGRINLDPCGHPSSPVEADHRFFLANGDDGLTDPWVGEFAFVNPPFSEQLPWLRRAYEEWAAGHVQKVVVLIPTRTDSPFFQQVVKAKADLYFIEGRLKFASPEGKVSPTPHSTMLVIFGASAGDRARLEARVPGFWVAAGRTAPSRPVVEAPLDGSCVRFWYADHMTGTIEMAARVWSCSSRDLQSLPICRSDAPTP